MKVVESKRPPRKWRWAAALMLLAMESAFAIKAWIDTMAVPEIKRTELALADFPMGEPPIKIALISDIHVAGPDMPPSRLSEIVRQINALKPDYLLVAGDFISEKRTASRLYSAQEAIAPLGALDESIIKVAVPGNHDHWFDLPALKAELENAGFTVLVNQAKQFGDLGIGGLDDDFTGHADVQKTLAGLKKLNGAKLVLSHSPDPFPDLPEGFGLMLAGHTHCGQIRYPWGGSPATMSRYGERYACGIVRENGNELVTTAGLGTSVLPFRLFSKPEIWLIEVGPL